MSPQPALILDSSIAQLQILASCLAEEMRVCGDQSPDMQARFCKEILLAVRVLIPKLQAARYVVTPG